MISRLGFSYIAGKNEIDIWVDRKMKQYAELGGIQHR